VDVAVVDVLVVMTCTYVGRADTIGPRQRVARALLQAEPEDLLPLLIHCNVPPVGQGVKDLGKIKE